MIEKVAWFLINRDLHGRVRIVVPEEVEDNGEIRPQLEALYGTLAVRLAPHAYPTDQGIIYESSPEMACHGSTVFPMDGIPGVKLVDRLATEGSWSEIAPVAQAGPPGVVFFSIKGGVGRSTALAATAWKLAQKGKRVLVVDLDLESPGISSSLLPFEKQPQFGVTDWMVEDLVDNADDVLGSLIATSDISHDGEVYVVPAHGSDPGEYVAKLGRVWMPKTRNGAIESWSERLGRMLESLKDRIKPDVVLYDSRAGIDEIASACVTELGANLVLLFAQDGAQTWNGYSILFGHWNRSGVVGKIRDRLQLVSAMTPDTEGRLDYLETFRDEGYKTFETWLYDTIQAGEIIGDHWYYEASDSSAPHNPWDIRWNQGFSAIKTLYGRLKEIDSVMIDAVFGPLIDGIINILGLEEPHD